MSEQPEPFTDAKAVAELYGLSTSTVYTFARQGMPHYRIGTVIRFRLSECDDWFKSQQRGLSSAAPDGEEEGSGE